MTSTFTIGIDTGGTFTDSFIADEEGRNWTVKVPTTPHDLTVCFADAIRRSAEAVGLDQELFLRRAAVIRFSSTIATNTALTLSGPKLGVIVTTGEERNLYGAAGGNKIFQFVPEDMVAGIDERVTADGQVERSPDPAPVNDAVRSLLERGARILVVSLANSTANPANEQAVLRIVNESYPRHYLGAVPTLLSTHVSSVADDASRTAAAIVNAYMHKKLGTSLYKAEDDLRRNGYRRSLLVVTSDGTVTRVAKTKALSTYQSGPTAGVHASALLAEAYELEAALTADVGGTSTDFGLVVGTRPVRRRSIDVGGLDVAHPSVELFSIALGGGSICKVEEGEVQVGPESAAAAPGPACFGMGGRDPTPTDAWLVLGYLDPGFYLGGRRKLKVDLARRALDDEIGGPLGLTTEEAALAVKEAAERTVAAGIEEMAARRPVAQALGGKDLAGVALIAYGGGGGLLLPSVARRLGMGRVFLSGLSPVFSAFGVSTFDVQHRYETRAVLDGGATGATLQPMVEMARRDIRGEGFDPESASMTVSVLNEEGSTLLEGTSISDLDSALAETELKAGTPVILSLSATAEVPKPSLPEEPKAGGADPGKARTGTREIVLVGGKQPVAVYGREKLKAGHEVKGPALIESSGSTYLIPEGAVCTIDQFGTAVVV